MVICPKCKELLSVCGYDDEIVCQNCGAAFCLEYLGYYNEGSNDRIDEGFEEKEWLDKYSSHNMGANKEEE